MSCKIISGLSAVVDDYDLFLVDQWGVLHDGFNVHPGAVEAMENLRATRKKVIILSNSGKRLADSYARMERMGIKQEFYDHVVTSGEQVYRNFEINSDPFYQNLGEKGYFFTWDEGSKAVAKGVGKSEAESIEDADFILCTGTDQGDINYYLPLLEKARAKNLPLICANPDFVSVQPDGSLKMCPGTVAKAYEDMGGKVRWHGKPTKEVYDYCKQLEPNSPRILGIGDSLKHDIKGANDAGGHSLFVIGGIHGSEAEGDAATQVSTLADSYDIMPTYALDKFVW